MGDLYDTLMPNSFEFSHVLIAPILHVYVVACVLSCSLLGHVLYAGRLLVAFMVRWVVWQLSHLGARVEEPSSRNPQLQQAREDARCTEGYVEGHPGGAPWHGGSGVVQGQQEPVSIIQTLRGTVHCCTAAYL